MFQNLLSKERSFTKKELFLLRKNGGRVLILVLLGEEGIGNPEPVFGLNLFLKGLMFQNLLSKERSFTKKELFLLRKNGGR
ncbi:MAG: hypothetical protein OCU20_01930, partial [Methanophagales archaeon]|nr:hypothetical protein [Methanophagales archaeon]MCW7072648.1 hypothetical protein [Methanophagales archaeon]